MCKDVETRVTDLENAVVVALHVALAGAYGVFRDDLPATLRTVAVDGGLPQGVSDLMLQVAKQVELSGMPMTDRPGPDKIIAKLSDVFSVPQKYSKTE